MSWQDDLVRDGFAVVENVVSAEALAAIRAEYAALLDTMCMRWRDAGLIADDFAGLTLEERFRRAIGAVLRAVPDWVQHFNIALPSNGITEASPIHLGPAAFRFVSQPAILDLAETLLGPEIALHPVGLVRIKLPERAVPEAQRSGLTARAVWHQDRGIGLAEFDRARFLTVWMPVTEATAENGCVQVVPGSHRGGLIEHCPGGVTAFDAGVIEIPPDRLPGRPVPVPMRPGNALLIDPLLVHGSGANASERIRWSFDLRYLRAGDPTGRPEWPCVTLRGPGAVDHDGWRTAWLAARASLARLNGAALPHRWKGGPACA